MKEESRIDSRFLFSVAVLLPLSFFIIFLFLAPLYFNKTMLQEWWWGGLQVWNFPFFPYAWQFLAPLVPIFILCLPEKHLLVLWNQAEKASKLFGRYLKHFPGPVFLVGLLLLWLIRPVSLIFGDATFYVTDLIPKQALSDRGITLMFDSIGVTLMYSRGYRMVHLLTGGQTSIGDGNPAGMDVLTWYNLVGIAFLMLFFWWIYTQKNKKRVMAGGGILLLLFMGNWSEAAMGAPEHYGQLLLAILAFVILAIESLKGREPLWKPCLAYSIGAFFHLGIGWLFPALLYLIITRWKKETKPNRYFALYAMILPALLTWCLVYAFGFNVSFLADSNAARGKMIPFLSPSHHFSGKYFQYTTFDIRHLAHIFQEILLMGWPGIILLASCSPFMKWRKVIKDQAIIFLLIILGGSLVFNLLWNPDLEFWRDQDLFCTIGLAFCLLGCYLFVGIGSENIPSISKKRIFLAALLGGFAWRLPVVLYHSMLSVNYLEPTFIGAVWPF